MTDFKTSTKKVHGLGSAKEGVHHWIAQRFTAIANIILSVWVLCMISTVINLGYSETIFYMAKPINAICASLFVVMSFYHAKLGLQIIIEDYIHAKCFKIIALIAMNFIVFSGMFAGLFAILKIAL